MTTETEKLEDALKVADELATLDKDSDAYAVNVFRITNKYKTKHGEWYDDVIEQAARRYAEVLPLFQQIDNLLFDAAMVLSLITDECGDAYSKDCSRIETQCYEIKAQIDAIVAREG